MGKLRVEHHTALKRLTYIESLDRKPVIRPDFSVDKLTNRVHILPIRLEAKVFKLARFEQIALSQLRVDQV